MKNKNILRQKNPKIWYAYKVRAKKESMIL